jgi:adenylate cyclase
LTSIAAFSPRARIGSSLLVVGAAYFLNRCFDEAVPKLLLAIQEDPSDPRTYRFLASCYAHMRRLDEAGETIERLRQITPLVVPSFVAFRKPEHRELFLSGLRLAAGEAA